jgi:hypothetical protein
MKFQIIKPNFHPTMAVTGFLFGIIGGLFLWFFIWIGLHWVGLYYGGGTILAGLLFVFLAFRTETDHEREEKFKLNQQMGRG